MVQDSPIVYISLNSNKKSYMLYRMVMFRGRPNFGFGFGFGAETGKKFSFSLVSFSVCQAAASFGFGRNCQRVSVLTETGLMLSPSVLQSQS